MTIDEICRKYDITNYTINPDGSIDVNGDVHINFDITEFPLRFNKVYGNFDCGYNNLTTLKGCPKWVGGYFSCTYNKLRDLEYSPDYVGGYFNCSKNELTSLNGSTKKIKKAYDCSYNRLTSLKYGPEWVGGDFNCHNNRLTSLEYCPEYIGDYFDCGYNEDLYNPKGVPEKLGNIFYCWGTPIGSIFTEVDRNFLHAFNFYKVIKDDTVNLKRLKYVMDIYNKNINLYQIEKYYRIV